MIVIDVFGPGRSTGRPRRARSGPACPIRRTTARTSWAMSELSASGFSGRCSNSA